MKGRLSEWIPGLALGVALVSLAANAYLLTALRDGRAAMDAVAPFLDEIVAEDGAIRTQIRIPAGTPINLDVPIDERITIRVDTILPIDTRVVVPLQTPFGNYEIPIPIQSDIPVHATLPLRVRHTFQLRTSTAEDLVVPIVIGETP